MDQPNNTIPNNLAIIPGSAGFTPKQLLLSCIGLSDTWKDCIIIYTTSTTDGQSRQGVRHLNIPHYELIGLLETSKNILMNQQE